MGYEAENEFPYKFAEHNFFKTIFYDNRRNFIIYRKKNDDAFYVYDVSNFMDDDRKPVKWDLGDNIPATKPEDIKVIKDLDQRDLTTKGRNHLVLLLSKKDQKNQKVVFLVEFGSDLSLQKVHRYDHEFKEEVKRVVFYNRIIHFLTPKVLVKFTFPGGYEKQPSIRDSSFEREYNDMAVTRNGTYLFIRGYSQLVATRDGDPESPKSVILDHKFHHGQFHFTGYSNYLLNSTKDEVSPPSYYYFSDIKPRKGEKPKPLKSTFSFIQVPNPDQRSKHKVRFIQTKLLIYYLYPRDAQINIIEVYAKGSKFGKNKMKNHLMGNAESLDAGYRTGFSANRLIIENQNGKTMKSRLLWVYSNFLGATLKCLPDKSSKGKRRELNMTVWTTGYGYNISVAYDLAPWKKFAGKRKPVVDKNKVKVKKNTMSVLRVNKKNSSAGIKKTDNGDENKATDRDSSGKGNGNKALERLVTALKISVKELIKILVVLLVCLLVIIVALLCRRGYKKSQKNMLREAEDIVHQDKSLELPSFAASTDKDVDPDSTFRFRADSVSGDSSQDEGRDVDPQEVKERARK